MLGLSGCARAPGAPDLSALVAECTGRPDGPACNALLANRGVVLPTSTGTGSWDPASDAIFVAADGSVYARAWSGTLGEIEHHRLPGLAATLPEMETRHGWPTEEHETLVFADATSSYGSVVDVLYTADRNHLAPLSVGVQTEAGPAALPVGAPLSWNPDDTRVYDRRCCMNAELEPEAIELEPCGGARVRLPLSDVDGIAELAEEQDADGCVSMRGDPKARWRDAVAVLDAIRSPGCPLEEDRADRDRGCRPISVSFDHDPPIPWRPGNWDAITVSVGKIDLYETAKRPRDEATLRARAEAVLPEVTECLRTLEIMRLQRPETVTVTLMTDAGREVSMPMAEHPRSHPLCVGEAFAPIADRVVQLLPGDAVVFFEIDLP